MESGLPVAIFFYFVAQKMGFHYDVLGIPITVFVLGKFFLKNPNFYTSTYVQITSQNSTDWAEIWYVSFMSHKVYFEKNFVELGKWDMALQR